VLFVMCYLLLVGILVLFVGILVLFPGRAWEYIPGGSASNNQ